MGSANWTIFNADLETFERCLNDTESDVNTYLDMLANEITTKYANRMPAKIYASVSFLTLHLPQYVMKQKELLMKNEPCDMAVPKALEHLYKKLYSTGAQKVVQAVTIKDKIGLLRRSPKQPVSVPQPSGSASWLSVRNSQISQLTTSRNPKRSGSFHGTVHAVNPVKAQNFRNLSSFSESDITTNYTKCLLHRPFSKTDKAV